MRGRWPPTAAFYRWRKRHSCAPVAKLPLHIRLLHLHHSDAVIERRAVPLLGRIAWTGRRSPREEFSFGVRPPEACMRAAASSARPLNALLSGGQRGEPPQYPRQTPDGFGRGDDYRTDHLTHCGCFAFLHPPISTPSITPSRAGVARDLQTRAARRGKVRKKAESIKETDSMLD
jgi:hypothetical protein